MQKISLAIHGGAGTILKEDMTEELETAYRKGLQDALDAGYAVLENGGNAVTAVKAAVIYLEDNPLFNAGKGSVFTKKGLNEMDAAIMYGKTLEAGAVAGVRNIRNPIELAEEVMLYSGHVFLSGKGANDFAIKRGIKLEPDDYFYSQYRYDQWREIRDSDLFQLDHKSDKPVGLAKDKKFGTVGAVACDGDGNIAAATSTGGMTNKKYGRIGDSPLIGCGTYANNETCAISCTGYGEIFIRAVATYSEKKISKAVAGITAVKFSSKQSLDTLGNKIFERFYKIVPSVQLYFKQPLRSHAVSWIDLRTYLIGQQTFDNDSRFVKAGGDSSVSFPMRTTKSNKYINQLSFNVKNYRVLYPYDYQLQLQQGKGFYRANLNANYFFNYPKKGGMQVRLFAAKFGYIGEKNGDVYQYQPKLLAATGEEDYTYSNYFIGRTASTSNPDKPVKNLGIAAQQIMIRDGGLKLRLDQFDFLQGRSENWVTALNFNTTIPELFPIHLPLKLFLDVGTNAEAWQNNGQTSKFLYVGGLQLSLLKNLINIYAPLIYSKDFKSTLETVPEQNTFFKRLTFSIDIQNFKIKNILPQYPF